MKYANKNMEVAQLKDAKPDEDKKAEVTKIAKTKAAADKRIAELTAQLEAAGGGGGRI